MTISASALRCCTLRRLDRSDAPECIGQARDIEAARFPLLRRRRCFGLLLFWVSFTLFLLAAPTEPRGGALVRLLFPGRRPAVCPGLSLILSFTACSAMPTGPRRPCSQSMYVLTGTPRKSAASC